MNRKSYFFIPFWVLATTFDDPSLSGLSIEHNNTVRVLLPKLSLIGQIACFQDDNYERPDVAGHRSLLKA
jgi:hypothetical protein